MVGECVVLHERALRVEIAGELCPSVDVGDRPVDHERVDLAAESATHHKPDEDDGGEDQADGQRTRLVRF